MSYRYSETPQLREILTELAWDMHFIKEEGTRRSGVVGKEKKPTLSETLVRRNHCIRCVTSVPGETLVRRHVPTRTIFSIALSPPRYLCVEGGRS